MLAQAYLAWPVQILSREAGRPFLLLEKSDAPGGRIATDHYEGFKLDRGFQVLLTAYPEAEKALDYPSLKLRNFYNGSRVWFQGRFSRLLIHSGTQSLESHP